MVPKAMKQVVRSFNLSTPAINFCDTPLVSDELTRCKRTVQKAWLPTHATVTITDY